MMSLLVDVLRSPVELVRELDESEETMARALPHLLGIVLIGGAIFGAVIGSYRGGIQVFYAALKLPFFWLIPAFVLLPALQGLWSLFDVDVSYRRLAMATLVGAARTAVLSAALGPVLWLVYSLEPDYHVSILLLVATAGLTGIPGMLVLARSVPAGGGARWMASLVTLAIVGVCTAQTGWMLRPFVVRPAGEVALFRGLEADVVSALQATSSSSVGHYDGWVEKP